MLTRFHKVLIALFAIQVALAVVIATRSDETSARRSEPLLASFDAAKVTKIQIFAADGATPSIVLAKRGSGWVLASSFDAPVSDAKVSALLAPIAKLAAAAPIATQASRHKQLHVDDAEFERKVVLTMDGKDTTLFVGIPAGVRRTAVRLGGDARVFAVTGETAASIGSEPSAWVDPSYVRIAKDDLAKVEIQRGATTVDLARDGTAWKVSIDGAPLALAAGETLDTAAIDRIVGAASSIEMSAPGDPKRDASHPTATITLVRKAPTGAAGTSVASVAPVTIDVIADGASDWVHDRALPRAAMIDKSRLADVVEIARDKLVGPAKPSGPQATSGPAKASPATATKSHSG